MKLVILLVTFLPTLYEAWTDRKGETKRDKRKDTALLVVVAVLLTGVAYLVLVSWVAVPLFILMWRITTFDYISQAFMIRNGVISGNWFSYTGKTAIWDRLIAKVNPWIRFGVRLLILLLSLWLYVSNDDL